MLPQCGKDNFDPVLPRRTGVGLTSALVRSLQRQEGIAARAPARAADLAHGLKTPLAVLAVLAADVRDAGHARVADEIDAEVGVMKGHVERELARARSAQVPPLSHQATPIRPVAERLIAALGKISGRASSL